MVRPRAVATLLILALSATAGAQPADPYATSAPDPALAEQVATQLVDRAQALLDAGQPADAKQLANEALAESPGGAAATRARAIVARADQQLGVSAAPATPPTGPTTPAAPPTGPVDLTPIDDPAARAPAVPPPVPEGHAPSVTPAAAVHGALFTGLLGTTIGSFLDRSKPAAGAVPVGLATGIGGALVAPWLAHRLHWTEARVRTLGSGSVWGGVIGGLFADVVTGGNGGTVTAPGILVGSSIGSTLGGLGAALYASSNPLTRGDVALVDTLAGIGTLGGLTLGMLMQPAQGEAYSLNSVLGAAGGVIVGLVAAPGTNTTPRRMLRVAGLSLAGGALPFLLYAGIADSGTNADERVVGALSTAGLVGGAWLGFYLTRNVDVGLDVPEGTAADADDAPVALVRRSSDGAWRLGGLALAPLSSRLATNQHGLALTVLGARF